jgi:hypothetical protein
MNMKNVLTGGHTAPINAYLPSTTPSCGEPVTHPSIDTNPLRR